MVRSRALLVVVIVGCAGPPEHAVGPQEGPLFASSQVKPPPSGRAPLSPLPRDPARLARQRDFFAEGSPADKVKQLGVGGQPVAAGVQDLRASAIATLRLQLATGQTVRIETRQLSEGADTVLHLWARDARHEVAFDDDGGESPGASRIVYTAATAGDYVVLLRAYTGADDGRCDLVVDGRVRLSQAKFGGSGLPAAPGAALHAVLLNDGQGQEWPPAARAASDTLLLLLDAGGRLVGLDDDSGVELGSTLVVPTGAVLAVVGALGGEAEGSARLVVNDAAAKDTDGDGLGDGLEADLCLCAARDQTACGFDCNTTVTPQDSDGDGLSDAIEVLGMDHAEFPQLLPRWGADPRHKDLFVEIDLANWTDAEVDPPVHHFGRTLSVADAHAAARVFARLTDMRNPDGEEGIRLHLDVGQRCGQRPSGIDEVCGALCAWGPDGQQRCGQSDFPGPPAPRRDNLAPGRRHLFHVAVANCLVSGQAPGGASDHLEYDCDRFTAMAHELGHNLGLARHYGTPETGGGNCKPNYPSIMNYAYSDRFDGGREVGFSAGDAEDLDPRDMDETARYGGDDAYVGWLATRPFFFTLHDCLAPGHGCKIDWNRDGRLDPSVRAFISPMPNYGYVCENIHGNVLDVEDLEGVDASSGPAAAEMLRVGPDGVAARALHVVVPTRAAAGQVELRLNHTFERWGGWQGWQQLAGPALRADAQPAAATVPVGAGKEQLWIFACTDGAQPIHAATVDPDGTVSPLAPLPGQPAGLRARDVSLAVDGTDLVLLVRDDSPGGGDQVYLTQRTPAGWSGSFVPLVVEKAPLRSTVTPALAPASDGRIYLVTGDPDPPTGTGPYGRLHLYSGQTGLTQLRDEELWGLRFEDDTPTLEHVPWARPALAFVPHLDGTGQPLPEGRGYLALWWNRGTRTRHLWSWGQLDQQGAAFTLGRWHHYEAMSYTDALAGSGPALVVREGGGLAALLGQADRVRWRVRHIPYADGIPDTALTLRDFDDRQVIRENLCTGLNWDCPERCKRLTDPCGGKQTQALTEVRCALPRWPELDP